MLPGTHRLRLFVPGGRMLTSSSSSSSASLLRSRLHQVYRKIHPDVLHQHQQEQKENEKGFQELQALLGRFQGGAPSAGASGPVSFRFWVRQDGGLQQIHVRLPFAGPRPGDSPAHRDLRFRQCVSVLLQAFSLPTHGLEAEGLWERPHQVGEEWRGVQKRGEDRRHWGRSQSSLLQFVQERRPVIREDHERVRRMDQSVSLRKAVLSRILGLRTILFESDSPLDLEEQSSILESLEAEATALPSDKCPQLGSLTAVLCVGSEASVRLNLMGQRGGLDATGRVFLLLPKFGQEEEGQWQECMQTLREVSVVEGLRRVMEYQTVRELEQQVEKAVGVKHIFAERHENTCCPRYRDLLQRILNQPEIFHIGRRNYTHCHAGPERAVLSLCVVSSSHNDHHSVAWVHPSRGQLMVKDTIAVEELSFFIRTMGRQAFEIHQVWWSEKCRLQDLCSSARHRLRGIRLLHFDEIITASEAEAFVEQLARVWKTQLGILLENLDLLVGKWDVTASAPPIYFHFPTGFLHVHCEAPITTSPV